MPNQTDYEGSGALANLLGMQPQKTSPLASIMSGLGIDKLLDDQKRQYQVAGMLGIKKAIDRAESTAREWSSENKYEDYMDDTLRHILLGGLLVPEKGKMDIGKRIGGALINVREWSPSEDYSPEDLIDINNNDFGAALRRDMMERGEDSPEAFIEMAKGYVTQMGQGERGEPIKGLEPQRSTVMPPIKTIGVPRTSPPNKQIEFPS